MKRIYLQKNTQRSKEFYTGSCDPRILIRMVGDIQITPDSQAQRPLTGHKVKEIADYVSSENEDGMLPSSVILGTKVRGKLDVVPVHGVVSETGEVIELYAMDLPDNEAEFEDYREALDIMDGQHRLFSFREDYLLLKDDVTYEIPFSLYVRPTLTERRQIFKITNEKQDKVDSNLLMWFREKLDMLTPLEKQYHPLVTLLNMENCSPLKGRLIMGSEKIYKGLKAQQLIGILHKAKINDLSAKGEPLSKENQLRVICTYLEGWEEYFGFKFSDPKKENGPAAKISGLRYMLLLLPNFWNYSVKKKKKFDSRYVKEMLDSLTRAVMVPDGLTIFTYDIFLNSFRGEGATVTMAENHSRKLALQLEKEDENEAFDPLG